jgi:phosphatidylserine/phosphatidylglycerophosphate/cardiolipin synthase-like enzyme
MNDNRRMQSKELQLAELCAKVAAQLTGAQVQGIASVLVSQSHLTWGALRHAVLAVVTNPRLRALLSELMTTWPELSPNSSPRDLAVALLSAARATAAMHQETTELVWTGPDYAGMTLRRTDQALLEVIQAAQRELLIVSFAVYMVPAVAAAIEDAGQRDVVTRICLETSTTSEGQVGYDTIAALGSEVRRVAHIYTWPLNRRPQSTNSRPGLLHVKCAVADDTAMFISSANLTGQALNANIELGVLIRHGHLPGNVAQHFRRLMAAGILMRVE